jgi:hypothetical protein
MNNVRSLTQPTKHTFHMDFSLLLTFTRKTSVELEHTLIYFTFTGFFLI